MWQWTLQEDPTFQGEPPVKQVNNPPQETNKTTGTLPSISIYFFKSTSYNRWKMNLWFLPGWRITFLFIFKKNGLLNLIPKEKKGLPTLSGLESTFIVSVILNSILFETHMFIIFRCFSISFIIESLISALKLSLISIPKPILPTHLKRQIPKGQYSIKKDAAAIRIFCWHQPVCQSSRIEASILGGFPLGICWNPWDFQRLNPPDIINKCVYIYIYIIYNICIYIYKRHVYSYDSRECNTDMMGNML